MNQRQFIFSVVVGAALIALGLAIASQDTVGHSLLALGLVISALNLFSYKQPNRWSKPAMASVRADKALEG